MSIVPRETGSCLLAGGKGAKRWGQVTLKFRPLEDSIVRVLELATRARRRVDMQELMDGLRGVGWKRVRREKVVRKLMALINLRVITMKQRRAGDIYVPTLGLAPGVQRILGGKWRVEAPKGAKR